MDYWNTTLWLVEWVWPWSNDQYCFEQKGGTAVDSVEAAVRVLESNEYFNAGCGSFLNNNREVECGAMIMEGHTLDTGRVNIQ